MVKIRVKCLHHYYEALQVITDELIGHEMKISIVVSADTTRFCNPAYYNPLGRVQRCVAPVLIVVPSPNTQQTQQCSMMMTHFFFVEKKESNKGSLLVVVSGDECAPFVIKHREIKDRLIGKGMRMASLDSLFTILAIRISMRKQSKLCYIKDHKYRQCFAYLYNNIGRWGLN